MKKNTDNPPSTHDVVQTKLHELERSLRQAEMLLGISHKLAAIGSLDGILETFVNMAIYELSAERGSIFLNDRATGELYSIVAQGGFKRQIRFLNTSGIAGDVFKMSKGVIVNDAYKDKRFNREIDQQTGFKTRNMVCVPIVTGKSEVLGVVQILNKQNGKFAVDDMNLLEAMTTQAAIVLQTAQFVEQMQCSRAQELEFLDIVADITSEIELSTLLQKVMSEATKMLHAERSTLFINDAKTNELWSMVGEGIDVTQIRFPNHLGIAGAVFKSGKSVNIPYAYADLRFNPAFDYKTGFFTRSILCTPVANKQGKVIGVTQVLNKRGGPFTDEDESRLKAFTAQISIALENAKLFNDIQNMKNYNESMLQSMSNGVITLDEEGRIITCNASGLRILKTDINQIISKETGAFFTGQNSWIVDKVRQVENTRSAEITMDAALVFNGESVSANVTVLPLVSNEKKKLGNMIILEDISGEKRMKSTMSRYMDPALADQLLAGGEDILGGKSTQATVLFSDIRGFTTFTEELGAHGTVSLLNEYFTLMMECIQAEGGMLDKFIGDAIMAGFGIPIPYEDNDDRALRCAIAMLKSLWQWNTKRAADRKKPIDIGIGLNTDTVVSGNIGSPKRMDFTMIGDGVNLASRVESACKQYGARILISENTYNKLRGIYQIRDIDDVIVKGKTKAVRIYEVLDYHTETTFPYLMEVVGYFREGRKLYQLGDWDRATRAFKESLKLHTADKLSKIYLERCEHLKANPPEGAWDGIWTMTSK
ncbi:GAF domain-containing protein [Candidatus Magnetominusculus xianensis]|uniref:Guanylate cyclase n=1 Tax=Candidatus Magnetominusculus xianensis TaxID=1748249 RepID=A0ABR5SBD9_9BACT|nr:GAF domain-containing protein [Candidatus Magnetominusculus xianensis]KWT76864.1 guanylate cyclase [Candidatus Magnetominusculus xianensis]MBF0402630.1 GAF domain-containing protein [Nitrospirota bacterium]